MAKTLALQEVISIRGEHCAGPVSMLTRNGVSILQEGGDRLV